MDDVKIPAADQERLDHMVEQYRHQLTNLYRLAYMQGDLDSAKVNYERLKGRAA